MTVVYIDQVFALNLLLDYLLLLTTSRLAGMPLQRKRLFLCAALGGTYASVIFLPACSPLGHPLLRLFAGLVMVLLAYWPLQHRMKMAALFFLISGALGGIVLAVGLAIGYRGNILHSLYDGRFSWPLLVGTTLGLDLLLHLLFRQGARHGEGELMRIHISVNGTERQVLALHDTGNTLRDPINGQPVLVLEERLLQDLWDEETGHILHRTTSAEEAIASLHRCGRGLGFTLLPFHSVGVSSGILLAVRSDYIRVGRANYPRAWIALTKNAVSDGGAYHALWGGTKRGEEYAAATAEAVPLDSQAQQAG